MLHNTAVTNQWTAKWPYIANAFFRITQNHGEQSYFRIFQERRSPQSPRGSAPVYVTCFMLFILRL